MENITYDGVVEHIVYYNKDNGYSVFELIEDESNNEIVCVGNILELNEGEHIKVTGVRVEHPSYGEQFKIEAYEKSTPSTEKGMERYLKSGIVKGIGPTLAKRIVKKFGIHTFDVIEQEPEKLADIKGITLDKARSISNIFHEQLELRDTIINLQKYNITNAMALKIFKKYKTNSLFIIKNNPYVLAEEIAGIGFKLADEIALKSGIPYNSEDRIRAGIKYILVLETGNGNVYLPKEILIKKTNDLLNCNAELIEDQLTELRINRGIVIKKSDEEEHVYLNSYHYAENYVSKKLVELSKTFLKKEKNVSKKIDKMEKRVGIKLADNQRLAVEEGLSQGVLVITGGPGTGKTTTINTLLNILEDDGYEILLAAPIGRASKRMSETTNREAKTIHRLLGVAFGDGDKKIQTFDKNEDNPIEADVIIVDETSMIDIMLMSSFLKAVEIGTRIIMLGDVDQLPSVGAGNVLKDIINSGVIKVVKLDEIFRQAKESAIIMNAHKINNGEYPTLNDKEKDFFFSHQNSTGEILKTIEELVAKRLPKFKNCDPIRDIQVLTPVRKTEVGVNNLNKVLQERLNPKNEDKREKIFKNFIFREGDKVMHIKNNYNMQWKILSEDENKKDSGMGVFNGEEGIIEYINEKSEVVRVVFNDEKVVDYEFNQLEELDLSYATTIHKAQGSEYKIVVMPMYFGPPMLMNRNLLYTGVTRSKELAVLVGVESAMKKMIDNNSERLRYTGLKDTLIELYRYLKEDE